MYVCMIIFANTKISYVNYIGTILIISSSEDIKKS